MSARSNWLTKLGRDEIVKKLFWTAMGLIGIMAVVVYNWLKLYYTPLELILASILLSLVLVDLGRYLVVRNWYRVPWYPHVGHHYLILEKTIGYEVQPDDTLHFWRRVKAKALADNLDTYIDKYVWTGGTKTTPQAGQGVIRVDEDITASLWSYYRTVFPRALRKGEVHEFQVDWHLYDWKNSRPFFSTSTEEPTKRLTFLLDVPESCLAPGAVYAEVMRGIESSYPFSVELLNPDRGRVTWSIKPKLYRHYRLRWAWKGSPPVQPLPNVNEERSEDDEALVLEEN